MKTLYCRDAGFDCAVVIRGESSREVLNDATIHLQEAHGVTPDATIFEDMALLISEE